VIVLHGNHPDANGQMMRDWTTFDEQAGAFGFAVAYPDGIGGCWADGRGVTAADRSAEVLRAWLDWTRTVPDEVTSVGRMLQFPPLPVVPEPLRGQSFAVLELVFLGDKADGDELTEPLRALRPVMDTIGMVPPAGIAELHMDPREPMPYVGEGQLLGRLARHARLPVHDVRRRRARRGRDGAPPGPGADRDRARSLRYRPPVPQLHRGQHESGPVLPARRLPSAARRQGGVRPGRPVSRQPPDPARLVLNT
jgi:hypothetical protein